MWDCKEPLGYKGVILSQQKLWSCRRNVYFFFIDCFYTMRFQNRLQQWDKKCAMKNILFAKAKYHYGSHWFSQWTGIPDRQCYSVLSQIIMQRAIAGLT